MRDFVSEYQAMLLRRSELVQKIAALPKGYISKKKIGAKQYLYLQTRNGDTVESKYIKAGDAGEIANGLALRKQYEAQLAAISERLAALEQAAALLDGGLLRKLQALRLCDGMDRISPAERERRISFSDAMTSIEGVPVSARLRRELAKWKSGSVTILSVLEETLARYGFATEV